jgi:hypothetical protein
MAFRRGSAIIGGLSEESRFLVLAASSETRTGQGLDAWIRRV